jgi:hypothetical protein
MIGAIVRYAGGPFETEDQYPEFAGAVGYIIGRKHDLDYDEVTYEIKWFKPIVVMGGLKIEKSYFSAARFEVLAEGGLSDEISR